MNELSQEVQLVVLSKALTGRNTRQALEVMPQEVQSETPDLLTIQYGANDSVYWQSNKGVPIVSKKTFEANLLEMVERARLFGVRKIFLITNHKCLKNPLEPNGKTRNQNLEEYNQIIRNVAAETCCELIDIYQILSVHDPATYVFDMPDGVHLNENGCFLYSEIIYQYLKDFLFKLENGIHAQDRYSRNR